MRPNENEWGIFLIMLWQCPQRFIYVENKSSLAVQYSNIADGLNAFVRTPPMSNIKNWYLILRQD